MRKWIIGSVLVAVVATVVWAIVLDVTVPPGAATSNASAQCERIKIANRVLAADWDNDICATWMARAGVRQSTYEEAEQIATDAIAACRSAAINTAQDTMNDFDDDWPLPATPSECGDSNVDTEYGEDCDDGTETATCDDNCTDVSCGDGDLNVTAGEECDDGNTDAGDGCDASCLLE